MIDELRNLETYARKRGQVVVSHQQWIWILDNVWAVDLPRLFLAPDGSGYIATYRMMQQILEALENFAAWRVSEKLLGHISF
jgi:hypothetical protein